MTATPARPDGAGARAEARRLYVEEFGDRPDEMTTEWSQGWLLGCAHGYAAGEAVQTGTLGRYAERIVELESLLRDLRAYTAEVEGRLAPMAFTRSYITFPDAGNLKERLDAALAGEAGA